MCSDSKNMGPTGIAKMDNEKLSVISDIIRCAVCLELPKGLPSLQVHTCEKGHHFCSSCHKKLKTCAICRGRFFSGRNFVVEELITKLGPNLMISQEPVPPPTKTPQYTPGSYYCHHSCTYKFCAGRLLKHIRESHPDKIVDNYRSNPFNCDTFDWMCSLKYCSDMNFSQSIHVSDFGLFTLIMCFKDSDLFGCVTMAGDETYVNIFRYRITIRFDLEHGCHECTFSNLTPQCASVTAEQALCSNDIFRVKSTYLNENVKLDEHFNVLVSIWKASETNKDKEFEVRTLVPQVPQIVNCDRQQRRNKQRNFRKKKLKHKLKKEILDILGIDEF